MVQQLPTWQDPGVEPPELLKTNGWQPGMKPSAQHMNWLFNRIYKCLEEIQAGGGTEELEQELAALQQALATHSADNIKHVTPTDRTNWNGKAPAVHTHTIDQVTGLQTELDKKVNESMRNAPNGFPGLDANGNLPPNLVPGVLKKISELDLAVLQSSRVSFSALSAYRVLEFRFIDLKHDYTGGNRELFMEINDITNTTGPYVFGGSHITGTSISQTANNQANIASLAMYTGTVGNDGYIKMIKNGDFISFIGQAITSAPNNSLKTSSIGVNKILAPNVDKVSFNLQASKLVGGKIELWGSM
ncbi:hypothetical protein MKX53_17385 [Psychrobacillus sp. FSL K6-4615]|uniref:hypothetical protein n=1 Tax=Psychrobacillus sp. FSL K6-4615 TaxID=2921551 RepID=UPI0030F864EC